MSPSEWSDHGWHRRTPYSTELLFALMQWLVFKGLRTSHGVRLYPEALDVIEGQSAVPYLGHTSLEVNPATWWTYFRNRFSSMLLSPDKRGRFLRDMAALGFCVGESMKLRARHRVDGSHGHARTLALADYVGRTLRCSYNPAWPAATCISGVTIVIFPDAYALKVRYGLSDDFGSSFWEVPDGGILTADPAPYGGLAVPPVRREPFYTFLERAHTLMENIVTPSNEVSWSIYCLFSNDQPPRPVAYVLAPSMKSAIEFWRETSKTDISKASLLDATWCFLPMDAHDRRCAISIHPMIESPRAELHSKIRESLLAIARPPHRSVLSR